MSSPPERSACCARERCAKARAEVSLTRIGGSLLANDYLSNGIIDRQYGISLAFSAMEIVDNVYTTLRAIGKDEKWLHQWILEKPARLGLGNITVKNTQLIHYRNGGGRLDLLAYRGDLDTYCEIEPGFPF